MEISITTACSFAAITWFEMQLSGFGSLIWLKISQLCS